ncbi:Metallo-dependent phosphatase-like protein [Infundibulicybe gibba]|nr:Metallo-dependent phosphatase-like protein [Infundibulicybe gibba]
MPPLQHLAAYSIVTLFLLFFFSFGFNNQALDTWDTLTPKNEHPDFGHYKALATLSADEFPMEEREKRVIVVGDIHGMSVYFRTLLNEITYDPSADVLVHVGDIVSKGPQSGSMEILEYMSSHNVTGVRGNHDQMVIEWRGWLDWVQSFPGGKRWLERLHASWDEAQESDKQDPGPWLEEQKQKTRKSEWWKRIPSGWILFGDHYRIAYSMSKTQYAYLLSLPLKLHIPSAHAYIAHAGLLASDPMYPPTDHRQPLSHIPTPPFSRNNTQSTLRLFQEVAIMSEVPSNKNPWAVLNMRSVKKGKVVRTKGGTPWSDLWNRDMSHCKGFDLDREYKCHPATIIYGHSASRGLDIKRWSLGLDTGCVYGKRLSALILGSRPRLYDQHEATNTHIKKRIPTSVPFGDDGRASIVSVRCR